MNEQLNRTCYARDEEFGPVCGRDATRKDESGNTYCSLHDYLAAISGEMTYPIDATPREMAIADAKVYEVASKLRDEILADEHEIDLQLSGRWEK